MARVPKKLIKKGLKFNLDGIQSLVDEVEGLKDLKLEVGVLRNKKLQEIGTYHEYGTFRSAGNGKVSHLPPRPFLRPVLNDVKQDIMPDAANELVNLAVASTNKTRIGPKRIIEHGRKILDGVGEKMKHLVQIRILGHIAPKLKPKTVEAKRRKGSPLPTTPLIDRGDLYNSIDYRVRFKGRFTKKG